MSIKIVNGMAIPNMPWEECPKGFNGPIWRYSKNPVIDRHPNSVISRAFNSAVVPFSKVPKDRHLRRDCQPDNKVP